MLILTLINNKTMPGKKEKPDNGMIGKMNTKKVPAIETKVVDYQIY